MSNKKKPLFDGGGSKKPDAPETANLPQIVIEAKIHEPEKLFGRPPKFDSVEELQRRIDDFFAWCDPHIEYIEVPVFVSTQKVWIVDRQLVRTEQQPYTISGLAVFLDTTRVTLLDYEHLAAEDPDNLPVHLRKTDPKILRDFSYTIKKAKAKIESYVERRLLSGSPIGPIFNLKNNFKQWEDKTVVENPAEAEYHKQVEELRNTLVDKFKGAKKKK